MDDDPAIRETVETILRLSGYEPTSVTCGAECLDALRGGFRGLILMDVMMPGLDGWDSIAAIADGDLLEGNVVCMLTAVHDPGPKTDRLTECVMDYVKKPFTSEELLAAVEEAFSYV